MKIMSFSATSLALSCCKDKITSQITKWLEEGPSINIQHVAMTSAKRIPCDIEVVVIIFYTEAKWKIRDNADHDGALLARAPFLIQKQKILLFWEILIPIRYYDHVAKKENKPSHCSNYYA